MSTCDPYHLWHKLSWCCTTLLRPHMEVPWTLRRDYQWLWHSVCLPIHAQAQQTPRNQDCSLYSILPTNWWSNRTYQPGDWTVSDTVCQPPSGRLVWMGLPRWVHIQPSNPLLHPNNSLHASMLDNGQHPRLEVEPIRETRLETLREFTDHMEIATNEACSALQRAADDMAHFYDIHHQHAPTYKVDDKV